MTTATKTKSKPAPIPLAAVASLYEPRDVADLRWFLQADYEGDVGRKSNLGGIVAQLELGCPTPQRNLAYDVSDAMLVAGGKLRRLERRWLALDARSRQVLGLLYASQQRPLPEWGFLGVIVLNLRSAHVAHARSGARKSLASWLARLAANTGHAELRARLRWEAEERVRAAVEAWERTRAKVGARRAA